MLGQEGGGVKAEQYSTSFSLVCFVLKAVSLTYMYIHTYIPRATCICYCTVHTYVL